MADYYTLFSFELTDLTEDERAWLAALLTYDDAPGADLAALVIDPEWVGFSSSFEDDGRSLWVFADCSGTPEDAANVVQAFLARFRPHQTFAFEWANTCSKPRLDAFGGGAVVVTATEQRWMTTSQWLTSQVGV